MLMLCLFISATASFATDKNKKAGTTQKVDTQKSTLGWTGRKVTGEHNGKIQIKDGSLVVNNNTITGGEFIIDMGSITVEDIKDPSSNAKLVNHLKSDDFFSSDKHPTALFKITSVSPVKNGQATITGDLTIKGITHSISFPATIKANKDQTLAQASFDVDRSKWDIRFGSNSFFDNLGNKAIYDNFTLDLNLVAVKKQGA